MNQSSHIRQVDNNDMLSSYENALHRLGYRIIQQIGDGNCLFRSISHQIYGNPEYHLIIRHKYLSLILDV